LIPFPYVYNSIKILTILGGLNSPNAPRPIPSGIRLRRTNHLLQANLDIRTILELLGRSDVRTTMIYIHTITSRT
jgi:site-specific recombinase XerC